MILSEADARGALLRILQQLKTDNAEVSIAGGSSSHLRFARNSVSTSGAGDDFTVTIRASIGRRTGIVALNQLDEGLLRDACAKAEAIARLAPEDPEYMVPLGPQVYTAVPAFFETTAATTPARRAALARAAIEPARSRKLVAAGFVENSASFHAFLNSRGNFGYHTSTRCGFSATVRTADGGGSGYGAKSEHRIERLDGDAVARRAVEKAMKSASARVLEPGKYPVILEPEAVEDLLGFVAWGLDARAADEGRSFFATPGGGNKVGAKVASESVTIRTDPWHPDVPGAPFSGGGVPSRKMAFIEGGVLKNLTYDRYWAEKQKKEPVGSPTNLVLNGGNATLDDLIRGTDRGILVTRLWYIRMVDPQTMLLTGLTRDGTFWIEKGRVKHPIKNFRFNESPMSVLSNVEALSRPERTSSGQGSLVPALKVKEFNFSSLSEAV